LRDLSDRLGQTLFSSRGLCFPLPRNFLFALANQLHAVSSCRTPLQLAGVSHRREQLLFIANFLEVAEGEKNETTKQTLPPEIAFFFVSFNFATSTLIPSSATNS
jgi:hypothetical protein